MPWFIKPVHNIIENSFVAALQLGLKEKFGGQIDHLRVAGSVEPDVDTGISKRFLVIYDSVPGGTGLGLTHWRVSYNMQLKFKSIDILSERINSSINRKMHYANVYRISSEWT